MVAAGDEGNGGPVRPRFTLRQLDYFVATVEEGSILRAAERLHVSQSALSTALTELENALGARLLDRRKARGVSLTERGEAVLPRARSTLERALRFSSTQRDAAAGRSGPLVIGCFAPLAPGTLPRLLAGFGRRHPELTLDFVEGGPEMLYDELGAGRVDVGIVYDWGVPEDFESRLLFERRPHVLLAASHPLAERRTIDLAELENDALIVPTAPPIVAHVRSIFAHRGLVARPRHRTFSFELTRSLVARGLGYAIAVQHIADERSYEGLPVRAIDIEPAPPPVRVLLAWPKDFSLTPAARAFVSYARGLDWGADHFDSIEE